MTSCVCICVCDCLFLIVSGCVCVFKQKTAYEMRISDWSSDVCSSDLDPIRDRDAHSDATYHAIIRTVVLFLLGLHVAILFALTSQLRPEIGRAPCRERVCQYV